MVHRLSASERPAIRHHLVQSLSRREEIRFAYLHGSFIRDEAFRDIDVGIWTGLAARPRIDLELAVELSRLVGYPVDVRIVNDAPVSFLFHVLRGHLLVVRDERLLADVIERTARTYHDRAPLLRRATREAFA